MSEQAERLGESRIRRLVDRLRPGRVTIRRSKPADDVGPAFPGIGTFSERIAAWQAAHGTDPAVEAWTNPERWRGYLQTGWCEAHAEGSREHVPPT